MSLVKYNRTPSLFNLFFDDPTIKDLFMDNGIKKTMTMPAANIKESDDKFTLELALPGFSKDQFELKLDNDILKVTATSKNSKNEEGEKYHLKEFKQRSFERSFTLPDTVNKEKIDAKYNDGILMVELPKDEKSKAQPIRDIKVG